jgi:hypothetical protein
MECKLQNELNILVKIRLLPLSLIIYHSKTFLKFFKITDHSRFLMYISLFLVHLYIPSLRFLSNTFL